MNKNCQQKWSNWFKKPTTGQKLKRVKILSSPDKFGIFFMHFNKIVDEIICHYRFSALKMWPDNRTKT